MPNKQNSDISKLMQESANDAVIYCQQEHKITLDRSIESLQQLDKILAKFHQQEQQKPHDAEILFTISNMFAAYIGEVFIANVGGSWANNETDAKAPFIYIQFADKEFPFASVCYHKIMHDNTISVYDYVMQAMANALQ
ncbi:hypothetical protein [Rheinheimera salexigens]|uniref:DUF3806 domain-containing protein n=1 Tax=Rheinheimera salexigens TaxID=1628148 RepID=A0A1E7Q8C2_9GAMM|nr:hypothetical protein [Rheinheimera salexigens]OEY70442.1 hypothetical protein BI198_13335 [Rheinheimera salexigens]